MLRLALLVAALLSPAARADAPPAAAPAIVDAPPSTPAPARPKLLVLDVQSGDLDADQRATLTALVAARAGRFPVDVISSADLRQLLALEGDRQEAGCDDGSDACLAEIAGALGADLVLSTRAGKLDAVHVVTVQLFDRKTSTAKGRGSVEAWSLSELPGKLAPAVDELLTSALGPPSSSPTAAAPTRTRSIDDPTPDSPLKTGLIVGGGGAAGVGLVTAALGAVPSFLYGAAKRDLISLTRNFEGDADDVEAARAAHESAENNARLYNELGRWGVVAGVALVVAGGAALATGLLVPAESFEGGAP